MADGAIGVIIQHAVFHVEEEQKLEEELALILSLLMVENFAQDPLRKL